ncbi:MAG: radical SAM protein [Vulcanimicrobiaceae bacterium]
MELRVEERRPKQVLNRVRGMPFAWSINPYRGCRHECVFCYARETHAYLERDGIGSWGTDLVAKVDAAAVLRRELQRVRPGERVALGTATDPYQPLEARYFITRAILGELARAAVATDLITRSPLVLRDLELLRELARRTPLTVAISLPTLDAALARKLEPTVAAPAQRLRTVRALAAAGIRTYVAVAPIVPGLTDAVDSLRAVFCAAAEAGASGAWHGLLNLGPAARERFFAFLQADFPHLVAPYERAYRGRYGTAALAARTKARVGAARAGLHFSARPRSLRAELTAHSGAQLDLFTRSA